MRPPGTVVTVGLWAWPLWLISWQLHLFCALRSEELWLLVHPDHWKGLRPLETNLLHLCFEILFFFHVTLAELWVTWLMFAYTMENMSLRMRTLGWVYVKRSFLARKFPSEETISGAIFAVIITLLSYKGKRWSIQTQTLDILQWRHGNIVLTKEA